MNEGQKEYLTLKGVATRYDINWRSVLRHIDRGLFPEPVRFGRSTRWRIKTLDRWDEQGNPPVRPRVGRNV